MLRLSFKVSLCLHCLISTDEIPGVQSRGVGACLKHLVCNDGETDRRTYNSIVSENVLREIYLRPFEIAIKEANPRVVMTAYNKIVSPLANEAFMCLPLLERNICRRKSPYDRHRLGRMEIPWSHHERLVRDV
jgi:hypothetical protein